MADPSSEAIIAFRATHGLDPQPERQRIWLAQLGGMIVPLPNFRWRRAIIAKHDGHHLITGYPPTLKGELSVAAWEAGARSYHDLSARLLCNLLMIVGLVVQPKTTVVAFRAGRSA